MPLPLPERWKKLGPMLDELLALDARRQARKLAWLEATGDAVLAKDLRAMLAAYSEAWRVKFLDCPAADPRRTFPSLVGTSIAGYTIEAFLGGGSSGSVWVAGNRALQPASVALKILHLSMATGAAARRFAREARMLRVLHHPNIVRLHDMARSALGQPVMILELVRGMPITDYATARRLALPARLALFDQLLDAVAFAHAHRIVHGDIHPLHVLVGGGGHVKLIDFSIAAHETDVRAPRAFTPGWASPEQDEGLPAVTATDVFALGLLMRELFREADGRRRDPAARALHAVMQTATTRDPMRRFRDAGEMARALRRSLPFALQSWKLA